MAFSKAPSQSTYQTKEVKAAWALRNRDAEGFKDTIALNGFFDLIMDRNTGDKDIHFVKRDGTSLFEYTLPSGPARGAFYWEEQDKLFVAYSNDIAVITGSSGVLVTTLTDVFTSTTGDVGFCEYLYDTGTTKIVAADGTRLITIDSSNTVVTGSSVDQPTPFNPYIMFLDGYLFLTKTGTSDIYNSNLNDPLAYTAGDFISAEMVADTLIRITRLNNYILALGTDSIEFFYNAAVETASPLKRVETPVKNVGYLGGLVTHTNKMYFVGQTKATAPEVFVMEDWKLETLDNPPLRRFIQPHTSFDGAIVSNGGHDFYVLTVGSITYWMDLETKLWTRIAFQGTNTFALQEAMIVPRFGIGNVSVLIPTTGTAIYFFNPVAYQDAGVNFKAEVQTYKMEFDSTREKFMSRLMVVADKSNAGSVQLSWTDDDYQTYSSARTIPLSSYQPKIHRMGDFIERAFRFSYTTNNPLKLHHFEVDYNIGNR
jgi:hypothetical protein